MSVPLRDLAVSYAVSGEVKEAKKLLNRAIRRGEQSTGKDHPFVLALYEFYGFAWNWNKIGRSRLSKDQQARKERIRKQRNNGL